MRAAESHVIPIDNSPHQARLSPNPLVVQALRRDGVPDLDCRGYVTAGRMRRARLP